MDLLRPIVRNFSFDYYLRHDGLKIKKPIKKLDKSQYLSFDELEHLRFEKLKKLIRYAYDFNQFYRQRFDKCGFFTDDLKQFSDLEKLPPLTKSTLTSTVFHLANPPVPAKAIRPDFWPLIYSSHGLALVPAYRKVSLYLPSLSARTLSHST